MRKWQIIASIFSWLILSGEAKASDKIESDDLVSLKEAFSLSRESWQSADVETHFSLIRPEAKSMGTGGVLGEMLQDVDYEEVRNTAKRMNEGREYRIDDLDFNIHGSVATVTFNEIGINEDNGGIGAHIEQANNVIRVKNPTPKFPAYEAGIRAGDLLTKVDGVEVSISEESGKTFLDYLNKVKGKTGTSVTLTIKRGEAENQRIFDVNVTRKQLHSAGRWEERVAVSQIWNRIDGEWLRLHECGFNSEVHV